MHRARSGDWAKVAAVITMAVVGFGIAPALTGGGLLPAAQHASAVASTASSTAAETTAAGSAGVSSTPSTASCPGAEGPHPCTLDVYELAPGGAPTTDPAVAYYTPDDEVISNVYESLITYNGSQVGPLPSDFIPVLATCVPGSQECSQQFGESLVFDNNTTHEPQFYTFEIDANARFYDPSTGASWPVYPSDVMFSLARTMSFANLPFPEFYNGWILSQALLPPASTSWDGAIHTPYNNTPRDVLSSMMVNVSKYCPSATSGSKIRTNGCITFNVGASGEAWPYFLELIGDPLGGSVTPCGTFTYLGAGLPGFLGTTAAHGDGSCLLPGNSTSTSQAGFQNYLRTVQPTAWDGVQELAAAGPFSPQPQVRYTLVGSGPYYAMDVTTSGEYGSGGYQLAANPAYAAPQGCAGASYCLPEPGDYIPNVHVYWDNDDTVGIQEMIAGQADYVQFDPSHTSTVLQLAKQGTYGILGNVSSGSNWFMAFELNFSLTAEQANDPQKLLNVPTDFLSSDSLRQFLVHAYPYTSIEDQVWTDDGLTYGSEYGGAIPPAQSAYYDSSVDWPTGNPDTVATDVGGAAWWWTQATTSSSPYYDPQLASCSSSSPCQFPVIGWIGNPSLDAAISDWISEIETLSGGALKPYTFDQSGATYEADGALGNGAGNMPIFNWGWVPDYQDPTDYLGPMWMPNGSFSDAMALYSQFSQAQYHNAACGHSDPSTFANLTYWAGIGEIPTECQGTAYETLVTWANLTAHDANQTERAVNYDLISSIGNELALMVYAYINVYNYDYGSWLSPSGINTNPSVGGGLVQTWYTWVYASDVHSVTFQESGLPSATPWSVTMAGVTKSSTTSSIAFSGEASGSYTYTVAYAPGYGASPSNGTVTVAASDVSVPITFSAFTPPLYPVRFQETGLVTGTNWSVVIDNVGSVAGSGMLPNGSEALVAQLPAGTYTFVSGTVLGYTATAGAGFTVVASPVTVPITYAGNLAATWPVTFTASGPPLGTSWGVTVTTSTGPVTLTNTTQNLTFYVKNNTTYPVTFSVPSGDVAPAALASVAVNNSSVNVTVPITPTADAFPLTFKETGLDPTAWSVSIANLTVTSTGTSLTFELPNGTFVWTLPAVGGYNATVTSGSATVNGTSTKSEAVAFTPVLYAIQFFQSGLPAGLAWNVTIGLASPSSISYQLTFFLPNGTYPFSVLSPAGFGSGPSNGSLVVDGAGVQQTLVFGALYVVSFAATGLPGSATWSVEIASQNGTQSSSGNATLLNFNIINGTWPFSIRVSAGYTATPGSGVATVQGNTVTIPVAFSRNATGPSAAYLGTRAYEIIGGLAALAAIGFGLAAFYGRRTPPAPSPPQNWTEGPSSPPGGSSPPPASP